MSRKVSRLSLDLASSALTTLPSEKSAKTAAARGERPDGVDEGEQRAEGEGDHGRQRPVVASGRGRLTACGNGPGRAGGCSALVGRSTAGRLTVALLRLRRAVALVLAVALLLRRLSVALLLLRSPVAAAVVRSPAAARNPVVAAADRNPAGRSPAAGRRRLLAGPAARDHRGLFVAGWAGVLSWRGLLRRRRGRLRLRGGPTALRVGDRKTAAGAGGDPGLVLQPTTRTLHGGSPPGSRVRQATRRQRLTDDVQSVPTDRVVVRGRRESHRPAPKTTRRDPVHPDTVSASERPSTQELPCALLRRPPPSSNDWMEPYALAQPGNPGARRRRQDHSD